MAIYSIPSQEFMDVIYSLQCAFDVNNIVELYAGMGLFAHMYTKYTTRKTNNGFHNTTITAYDSGTCFETQSQNKYYDVKKESFEQLYLNRTTLYDTICVALMPSYDMYDSLRNFFDICRPECLVLVVNKDDTQKICENIPSERYNFITFTSKIITCLDYYLDNADYSHADTIIISRIKIGVADIQQIANVILAKTESIEIKCNNEPNDIVFNDCIMHQMFPKWMLNIPIDTKKIIMNDVYQLLKPFSKKIETNFFDFVTDNITSLDEFWEYMKWKPRPPIFCTKEKFVEYRTIYRHIINCKPLDELKQYGIIPHWIDNIKSALLYTYLEYESLNKDWKINKRIFDQIMTEYNTLL